MLDAEIGYCSSRHCHEHFARDSKARCSVCLVFPCQDFGSGLVRCQSQPQDIVSQYWKD